MRVSKQKMDQSHLRIVEGASRMIRERGIESTSVSDVMSAAGLTQGGFYRHFKTKEDLVLTALQKAIEVQISEIDVESKKDGPGKAVANFKRKYLSEGHVRSWAIGCPLAALGSEIGRASRTLKRSFNSGVKSNITVMAKGLSGKPKQQEAKAALQLATMVGAVTLARACDPETAQLILAACRDEIESAL